MSLMKKAVMLLVAVLGMVVATSVQAADATVMFFSQVDNKPVDVATDAHFKLTSGDDVVAEGIGSENPITVEPGAYTVVAEQPSTGFFGTAEVTVAENEFTDDGKEIEQQLLFVFNKGGLTYLPGIHACDCDDEDGNGDYDCNEQCICVYYDHNVTKAVCHCPDDCEVCHDHAEVVVPPLNNVPTSNVPSATAPYMAGGTGWGILGLAGLLGLIGLDDHPHGPSAMLSPSMRGR